MKKNIILLCLIFIVMLFSFASIYVVIEDDYQKYTRHDISTGEDVEVDPRDFPKDNNDNELLKQMAYDYFNLKEQNSHCIGWLNIPDIGYYPVMAYTDNQFYLTHNDQDKYSTNGAIFMNTASEFSFKDTALLHGHKLRSGKMFGNLDYYLQEKFFQNNGMVLVFDGEFFYYYKQYTVFLLKDGVESITQHGLDKDERLEYMTSLYNKSRISLKNGENPNLENQMLFLQTCNYSFEDARLVVGLYATKAIQYEEGMFD